jgi:hypothetical protein
VSDRAGPPSTDSSPAGGGESSESRHPLVLLGVDAGGDPACGRWALPYDAANGAVRTVRGCLEVSTKAKAAYDRTVAEGRLHQADLAKLRKARALAQKAVGGLAGMNQSEVSGLQRRSDLLLSTLRKFVEATGGELVMVARYPIPTLRYSSGEELDAAEVHGDRDSARAAQDRRCRGRQILGRLPWRLHMHDTATRRFAAAALWSRTALDRHLHKSMNSRRSRANVTKVLVSGLQIGTVPPGKLRAFVDEVPVNCVDAPWLRVVARSEEG